MIGVVDYRAGNAPSVLYALERLGLAATLVADEAGLDAVDRVILPGVGAAAATIASLEDSALVAGLTRRVVDEHVPFLGICIGLQVLFDRSEEGPAECLGWIPGHVRRFPDTDRVPQIGWNEVRVTGAIPSWPVGRRIPTATSSTASTPSPTTPTRCSRPPSTACRSAPWSPPATSRPPNSTPRRAARSGWRCSRTSPRGTARRADQAPDRVLRRGRRARHQGAAVPGQHRRRARGGARAAALRRPDRRDRVLRHHGER